MSRPAASAGTPGKPSARTRSRPAGRATAPRSGPATGSRRPPPAGPGPAAGPAATGTAAPAPAPPTAHHSDHHGPHQNHPSVTAPRSTYETGPRRCGLRARLGRRAAACASAGGQRRNAEHDQEFAVYTSTGPGLGGNLSAPAPSTLIPVAQVSTRLTRCAFPSGPAPRIQHLARTAPFGIWPQFRDSVGCGSRLAVSRTCLRREAGRRGRTSGA
jgi:hypothetical protein